MAKRHRAARGREFVTEKRTTVADAGGTVAKGGALRMLLLVGAVFGVCAVVLAFALGSTQERNVDDSVEERSPAQEGTGDEPGVFQEVTISQRGSTYAFSPSTIAAGTPVRLRSDGSLVGCGLYVVQRELGLYANFARSTEVVFTPKKPGAYTVACTMGMYAGVLTVV